MINLITQNMAPIMFACLIIVLLLGYPVAFSLAALGLGFWLIGMATGLMDFNLIQALPDRFLGGVMGNETLLAIPFFTFMGLILERSGMAEKLLDTVGKLFGPVRGGVAYAVIFVGALLAATTGVVAASVIAMGLISLPIMLRYGYNRSLASGVIAASGTLAQIIPPSLVLIVLADQLGKSVGDMYLGAFVPGFILTGLYAGYVFLVTLFIPGAAPALPAEARSFGEGAPYHKVIKAVVLPLALVVLGMLYLFDPVTGDVLLDRYFPFIDWTIRTLHLQEPYITIGKIVGIVVVYYAYIALVRFTPALVAKLLSLILWGAAAWAFYHIIDNYGLLADGPAGLAAHLDPRAAFAGVTTLGGYFEKTIQLAVIAVGEWSDWIALWALIMTAATFWNVPSAPVSRAVRQVVSDLLPPLILVFLVLGTIFRGIATPTEGGAMGAAGAVLLAILNRKLDWSLLKQAGESTTRLSAFVIFILIGARVFSNTFYGVNGHVWVEHVLHQTPGGMYGFLIVVMALIFVLAFFLDFFELAFIAVPLLVAPATTIFINDPAAVAIANEMGFAVANGKVLDPAPFIIWFGVLLGVNMQTSFMHPPFGFALFYLRSVAPDKPYIDTVTGKRTEPVTIGQIYWGAVPFVFIQVFMIGIVLMFPKTVMWYNDTTKHIDPSKVEINIGGPMDAPGMPGGLGIPGLEGPSGLGGPPADLSGPPPGLSGPPPGLGGPPADLTAPPPGLGGPPADLVAPAPAVVPPSAPAVEPAPASPTEAPKP